MFVGVDISIDQHNFLSMFTPNCKKKLHSSEPSVISKSADTENFTICRILHPVWNQCPRRLK